MKRNLLYVAMALALGASGAANAGLNFSPTGSGGSIDVGTFDWGPTSFLAKDGRSALVNWGTDGSTCSAATPCAFDVYTHSTLIGSFDQSGAANTMTGLGSSYEITMVARLPEVVTGVFAGGTVATFATDTSRSGLLEIYYSPTVNANNLEGTGFDDGTLILRGTTVGTASGIFTITGQTPMLLDQFGPAGSRNDYGPTEPVPPIPSGTLPTAADQATLPGTGSQTAVPVDSLVTDPAFFLNALTTFGISFANLSIGLPFNSADPSDCFTLTSSGVAVGAVNASSSCTGVGTTHVDGLYSAQVAAGLRGYTPVVGAVNAGLPLGSPPPDFVAQTDFNSPVDAIPNVPEPATLALLGLGLAGLGLTTRKVKKTA